MLSLGRNPGQYVVIGEDIVVQVVSMDGELRLAIDAPKDVAIQRGEVYEVTHVPPVCIRKGNHKISSASSNKTGPKQLR